MGTNFYLQSRTFKLLTVVASVGGRWGVIFYMVTNNLTTVTETAVRETTLSEAFLHFNDVKIVLKFPNRSLQVQELTTSSCKKNRSTSNFSFPFKEGENISVKGLHKKTGFAKHQLFKCTECDYASSQFATLNRHLNSVHKLHLFKYTKWLCWNIHYGVNNIDYLITNYI